MRHLPKLLLCACFVACGGGGGGGGGGAAVVPSPLEQTALMILEDCGALTVGDHLDVLAALHDVLDPSSPAVFRFQEVMGLTVFWTLDIDDDGTDDLAGSLRFRDISNDTFAPFNLQLLVDGPNPLTFFYGSLPPNSKVVVSYASAGAGNESGQVVAEIALGNVSEISVTGSVTIGNCTGTFSFSDVLFINLAGNIPTVLFLSSMQSPDGLLVGSIQLNGTNIATVTARLNGVGEEFDFTLDLATGAASS